MSIEGPGLEYMMDYLLDCDPAILRLPERSEGDGGVRTEAVVSDALHRLGCDRLTRAEASNLRLSLDNPEACRLAQLTCWIFHSPVFAGGGRDRTRILSFLTGSVVDLATTAGVEPFRENPERREELIRRCLRVLGMRPRGESEQQAANRYQALDSLELNRVIRDTGAAQARAEAIRKALADRRGRAAPTYGRE